MSSERVTVILGHFAGPTDRVDADWVYNKAQWLAGYLYRNSREDFFVPPVLRRERGEIFGLLKSPDTSYRVCTMFNEEIYPGSIRFAIVRDLLELPGDDRPEAVLIGRAGDRARQLLRKARSAGWCYVFDLGEEVPFNTVLTEMASLVHTFRNMWSDHQNKVIRLYRELGRQKHVAERLGITQQAVSDILKRAHWKEIKRAEKLIDGVLKRV
jgi:hypothetical protein